MSRSTFGRDTSTSSGTRYPGRFTLAASSTAFSRCEVAPSSVGVTTKRDCPPTSVIGRENRAFTSSLASAAVSPPTSVPPILTPAAISFGCGGAGVDVVGVVGVAVVGTVVVGTVVVGTVVVGTVVVGTVVVGPVVVVVPPSAPAPGGVASRTATMAPAAPQAERAAIVTPRFTASV